MRWSWAALVGLACCVTATAAAERIEMQALVALFPKPPATVIERIDSDFDGDGRRETAVLYDTPLDGRYRLGMVTFQGDVPVLLPQNLKVPTAVSITELAAVDLTGDGHPELRLRGTYGVHGSIYQLYALRHEQLVTELTLTEQAPIEPMERDIDEDGQTEIVRVTGNHYVWSYNHGLTDWQLIPLVWNGQAWIAEGWRTPQSEPAQRATKHLVQLAAARLWDRALETADEAAALEPGPITTWNRWLAEQTAWLFREQQRRHATPPGEPVANLVAAIADILSGDYTTAAGRLMAFGGPTGMPLGWEVPFLSIRGAVEQAFEAAPDLLSTGAGQIVRGFVLLAADQAAVARLAFRRAVADWPAPEALEPWTAVGFPPQRLYGIGPRQTVWTLDIDPLGRPQGPVQRRPELGQVRALAGSPTRLAFAYVPDSGERVIYQPSGPARTLLTGEFLHLDAAAFSPDGNHLAVDRGTGALRELVILDVVSGAVRATVPYAGRFAWSPSSSSLAIEVARAVEPPLPWEDGGTRDLTIVDLDGHELQRLAQGDTTVVWRLESWDTPTAIWAEQTRFRRQGEELVEATTQRLMIDPAGGLRTPGAGRSRIETEAVSLARRLKLRPDEFDLATATHPRFILFRKAAGSGADLWLLGRDLTGEPLRLGPVPPLNEALDVSWGALPR